MAQTLRAFTQPAQMGGLVDIEVIGDPLFSLDDLIYLLGYGYYQIRQILDGSNHSGGARYKYRAELHVRTGGSSANIVPAGTIINTFTESVQHERLTYNPVIALSFREEDYRTLTLTGNITFTAQHHAPGRSLSVRLVNNNSIAKTLSFPGSWTFLGGLPTTLLGNKTGVLSITCFAGSTGNEATASDLDVVAAWGTN